MKRSTQYGIAACGLMLVLVLAAAQSWAQQDKSQRPSPPGTANFTFADGMTITIDYSRPKLRDPQSGQPRKIFGAHEPYGKVWRAGANEATTFVTQADLTVGNAKVPAGSYTLYAIPQETSPWTLIICKKTGQWGIPYPGEQFDLARIDMKVDKLAEPMQQLTISLDKRGPKAGLLKLEWENTSASVDFSEAK
jgi:hypothetical protein